MIFLSVSAQHTFDSAHTILLCLSSVLNLVALFCLIYETPPHQAQIRKYLLLTQVMVIVNMLYMDVLFEPIPLFPALAGMCFGVLCRAGVPPHAVLGGLFISYAWLGLAIFLCCIYRHQTLLPEGAKYGKAKSAFLQAALLLIMAVPSVAYAAFPFDTTRTANLLKSSPYELGWALDRGPCFMHERTPVVVFFMASVVVMMTSALAIVLSTFFHMFYVLDRDHVRSRQTIRKIRRSLLVLFIQLIAPLCLLLIPGTTLFIALLCDCIPFETNMVLFSLMLTHPVAHNVILLGITPTYRRLMLSVPRRLRKAAVFSSQTRPSSIVYTIPKGMPRQC